MKKLPLKGLSFILIAALLCSGLGLSSLAGTVQPLSVHIITDVHFNPLSSVPDVSTVNSMPESVLYPHARYNAQLYAESEAILAEFFKVAAQSAAPVVLVPGDVVDGAQKAFHLEFAQRLADFETLTGKRVFVINGNNDIRLDDQNCASDEDFATIYADFGFNDAVNRDPSSLSYAADLDDHCRLLAIDSCKYGESPGVITPAVLQWIREQALSAKQDGKYLVAMMHHALLRHYGGFGDILLDRALDDDRVDNAEEVWEEFADLGIQTIFTGHMHGNSITKAVSPKGSQIFDIETNALVNYPCSYRTVTFSAAGVEVKTDTIKNIDAGKLQTGYTTQQLALIENDFPQYAYGYIAVSAKYMLKQYLVYPQYAIYKLGLDAESDLAQLLTALLPDMYDCFAMPLYKTDETNGASIEEIAALGGYTLPASNYTDIFDVLNVIIGNYTCGDANMPGDSLEVRLLLDCIKAVLVYGLGSNAEYITQAAVDQFAFIAGLELTDKELKIGLSSLMFRKNLVNRVVKSLALPFLEGVTKDAFPPGDVNVLLPAYGTAVPIPPLYAALFETIQSFFNKIMKMIRVFMLY